jgi:hypothetical protein
VADLKRLHVSWLAHQAINERDSAPLVAYLRGGGAVTPELAALIADVLEGKVVKAKPKRRKPVAELKRSGVKAEMLRRAVATWRAEIASGENHGLVMECLRAAGYRKPYPETKGAITKAAELLAARMHGLTLAQLDEVIRPRKARAPKIA